MPTVPSDADAAFVEAHQEKLEQALSDAVAAVVEARPENPVAFLSTHFAGEALKASKEKLGQERAAELAELRQSLAEDVLARNQLADRIKELERAAAGADGEAAETEGDGAAPHALVRQHQRPDVQNVSSPLALEAAEKKRSNTSRV